MSASDKVRCDGLPSPEDLARQVSASMEEDCSRSRCVDCEALVAEAIRVGRESVRAWDAKSDEERFKTFFASFGMEMVLMSADPKGARVFEIQGRDFSEYSAVLKVFFNGDESFCGIEVRGD